MRKYLIAIMALLTIASGASAKKSKKSQKETNTDITLTNTIDSVSYAIGVSVGTDIKRQLKMFLDDKQNNEMVATAFKKMINGDSVKFTKTQADSISNAYIASELKRKDEARKAKNTAFLAANAKEEGVITTESGLQYKKVKDGNGKKPTMQNTVKVHYEGKLTDGTIFDSSRQRKEPIEFKLDRVIKGWTEGLQLMDEGSEYILYIPYELGYGERQMGNIPPYSTLIFDVELLEVK